MKLKYYISSLRLRTLFLSASGIVFGGLMAASHNYFSWTIFLLSLLTAVSLQILSNLANELGDYQKGTDGTQRTGPIRSLQQGGLTVQQLKKMIYFFIALSMIFGVLLLLFSFDSILNPKAMVMLILGAACIFASIYYTVGKHPYGYYGWGDIFVFIFFGWVGVVGTYFLLTQSLDKMILLPASSIGFLATAVLNLNNIRDVENDKNSHKKTICVRLGEKKGKYYHAALIVCAIITMLIYNILIKGGVCHFLFVLLIPLFVFHIIFVFKNSGKLLDKHFPILVMGSFLWAFLAGIGLLF